MVIRPEQFQAFMPALEDDFVTRLQQHLRQRFPQELKSAGVAAEQLPPFVHDGIQEATEYGVVREGDVRRYMECKLVLGPGFDRELDWARAILNRRDINGSSKMDLIDSHMLFRCRWDS